MRIVIDMEKRKRLRDQRTILKAWREFIGNNRHLMQTNMAAINFTMTNRAIIAKNCFDALRAHKE